MSQTQDLPAHVEQQLRNVQELYAELFMLLMTSVEQDVTAGPGLDEHIGGLMLSIEDHMREFQGSLAEARRHDALGPELDGEVVRFTEQMREALTSMGGRVAERTAMLRTQREELKERIEAVRHKQRGAKGYRGKVAGGGSLLHSEA